MSTSPFFGASLHHKPRKMGMSMACPWWMTMAPVTPPELRQSTALAVDSEAEASPGTPPLDLKSAPGT